MTSSLLSSALASPNQQTALDPKIEEFLYDVPFPRIYMAEHSNTACVKSPQNELYFMQRARFANVVEVQSEYGDLWKIDANLDNDCEDSVDVPLAQWLEDQAVNMGANRWGVNVPRYQIAFVSTWNYNIHNVGPYREDLRDNVSVTCNNLWPLTTAANPPGSGNGIIWDANFGLTNVYTDGYFCNINNNKRYVEWYPDWLEGNVGSVTAWDGIRPDLQGNIHAWTGTDSGWDVDYDIDGCNDFYYDGTPPSPPSCNIYPGAVPGRHYVDEIYREGNQQIFAGIHALHPDWIIGGNDSWTPESGSLPVPGYARKYDINFTMAENWTNKWWGSKHTFVSWPDPEKGLVSPTFESEWVSADFADHVRIWRDWSQETANGTNNKGFVITSKWCSEVDATDAGPTECGNDDNGDGFVRNYGGSNNEYRTERKFPEFRFSLAAAVMLDAYHSFIGDGYYKTDQTHVPGTQKYQTSLVPSWFDEYAVYPDNEAADTDAEKEKGVGWLGMPAGDMMTVDSQGIETTTIYTALNDANWKTIINNSAWIRYFDHGVALLNPTGSTKSIQLLGTYSRIACSSGANHEQHSDCTTNNGGSLGVNPVVTVPAYDGLFLVKTGETASAAIAYSADDVEVGGRRIGPPGQYEWEQYQATGNPTISIGGDLIDWKADSILTFRNINVNAGAAIDDMFLELYLEPYSDLGVVGVDSDHHHGYVAWNTSLLSPGWVYSANLKDILIDEVNTTTWDQTLNLYLSAPLLWNGFSFRSYDYAGTGEYAPRLVIRHRGGGTPSTDPPTVVYQHGVNNYTSGGDTHIVTTNWEPPTPHDTFPILYLRTSRNEDEVKSSPVEFNNIALPPILYRTFS